MKTQPTTTYNPTFGNIYKYTKFTSYGKNINGESRGYKYNIHIGTDNETNNIKYKLYCVMRNNEWVKSFLRYFNNNKVTKEIRSVNKNDI